MLVSVGVSRVSQAFCFMNAILTPCLLRSVHEVQAFLVELISNFEFSLTEDIKRLRREPCGVMLPTLEGEVEKGVQMPLKVTLATQDE